MINPTPIKCGHLDLLVNRKNSNAVCDYHQEIVEWSFFFRYNMRTCGLYGVVFGVDSETLQAVKVETQHIRYISPDKNILHYKNDDEVKINLKLRSKSRVWSRRLRERKDYFPHRLHTLIDGYLKMFKSGDIGNQYILAESHSDMVRRVVDIYSEETLKKLQKQKDE